MASREEIQSFLATNSLFKGFTASQLSLVSALFTEMTVEQGTVIIRENEESDRLYIIYEGEVLISKRDPQTKIDIPIATLGENSVIGEIGVLDKGPRSATVTALRKTRLLVLNVSEIDESSHEEVETFGPMLYLQMIENIAHALGHRIRRTDDSLVASLQRELEAAKLRISMGIMSISTYVIIAFYTLSLAVITRYFGNISNTTFISAPLLIFFTSIAVFTVKKLGYPMSMFGVTLKNARTSAKEAVLYTIPFMLLIVVLKWFAIQYTFEFSDDPLFSMSVVNDGHSPFWYGPFILAIYVSLIFVQELLFRGLLQTSIQDFFIGAHKQALAVFISSLIFSVTHSHVSFLLVFYTFIFGLFWGWMYARQRTLVGVTLSHTLLAVWALFVVGVE